MPVGSILQTDDSEQTFALSVSESTDALLSPLYPFLVPTNFRVHVQNRDPGTSTASLSESLGGPDSEDWGLMMCDTVGNVE